MTTPSQPRTPSAARTSLPTGPLPVERTRRLRSTPALRSLVREHTLRPADLVLPMFVATTAMLRFGERTSWGQAALYGVLLTAGVVLVFGTALGVPFPAGAAERALHSVRLLRSV